MTSPSPLLDLASEDLESLSLQETPTIHSTSEISRLTRLTKLTSLELREVGWVHTGIDNIEAISQLPLQKLVLLNCRDLEQHLFLPDTLTGLRSLHMESNHCYFYLTIGGQLILDRLQDDMTARQVARPLKSAGSRILSLPKLHQISGCSDIFTVGMTKGLAEWDVTILPEGRIPSSERHSIFAQDKRKLWIRPDRI